MDGREIEYSWRGSQGKWIHLLGLDPLLCSGSFTVNIRNQILATAQEHWMAEALNERHPRLHFALGLGVAMKSWEGGLKME